MDYKEAVRESQKGLIKIEESEKEITVKAQFGPSKPTRIPFILNEDVACFVAVVIGDGHLKKDKARVTIDSIDEKSITYFQKICYNLFNNKYNITHRPDKGKERYSLNLHSKAIYNFVKNHPLK